MSIDFGLWIDFELRKSVTTLSTEPEVVCSRRGRHLEVVYDVITRRGRTDLDEVW